MPKLPFLPKKKILPSSRLLPDREWWFQLAAVLLAVVAAFFYCSYLEESSLPLQTASPTPAGSAIHAAPLEPLSLTIQDVPSSSVKGIVKNHSNWDYENVTILFLFYDKKGEMMGISYRKTPLLRAQENWCFQLPLPQGSSVSFQSCSLSGHPIPSD